MSEARRKGTAAESAVVRYLRETGFEWAERRALRGVHDEGDVTGIPGCVIEVKNQRVLALAEWVDQMLAACKRREAKMSPNAPVLGVVFHKRRNRGSPGDWYVTTTGEQFVRLLREAGY